MPKQVGRKLKIRKNGVLVAGVRTKTFTINNEPIDVTADDASGFRTLLEDSAQSQVDMSVEGLTDDDDLIEAAVNRTALIESYEIELPSGATITGDFRFNNLEQGATYNEAITFTGEIHSTGVYTFTAAA